MSCEDSSTKNLGDHLLAAQKRMAEEESYNSSELIQSTLDRKLKLRPDSIQAAEIDQVGNFIICTMKTVVKS